jgi:hypothetical protein
MPQTAPPPLVLKIFGVLHCFFGSTGLLASPVSIRMVQKVATAYERLGLGTWTIKWLKLSIYLTPATSLLLLALGLGLWWRRAWACTGAVGNAWLAIALAFMSPLSLGIGSYHGLVAGHWPTINTLIASTLTAMFVSIYPMLTIFCLNRPAVKTFFWPRKQIRWEDLEAPVSD